MKLKFETLKLRLAHPWSIARAQGTTEFKVVIVELADQGVTGRGEAAPVKRYNESTETVSNFLQRLDPDRLSFDNVAASTQYLNSISSHDHAAKCAVNIALLDGAAKLKHQPIHAMLGLPFSEHQHVTSFTIGIDSPEVIREKVKAAESFPILKMKVGVPADKLNLSALREVAPDKIVRVDANEGWQTREQALEMIEWLARDGRVQFIEQPLPASTPVEDWIWLKRRSPLPIFGDESYHGAEDAERAAQCFHGVNVKLVKTGGISGAFEALQAARQRGLSTMLGCMIETSVLISAAAHLAALCDHLDLDGNLLITNDPFKGVTADKGMLSFEHAVEKSGLRVSER